jgi:hypothetical protein
MAKYAFLSPVAKAHFGAKSLKTLVFPHFFSERTAALNPKKPAVSLQCKSEELF